MRVGWRGGLRWKLKPSSRQRLHSFAWRKEGRAFRAYSGGLQCASWLAAMVEEASQSPVLEDFVQSYSKSRKSSSMRGGCNKAGRFLEVVAFVDDDWKGIIWIPEAHSGWGWRRFVVELRSLVAALASYPGSSSEGSLSEEKSRGSF
jgi:hypothetical protein